MSTKHNLMRKADYIKAKLNSANLVFGERKLRKGSGGISETETPEKIVTMKLKWKLGGELEVGSRYGKIDLLTNDSIIEVKRYKSWKHALGQVLIYGLEYPNHEKKLYLFGSSKPRPSTWSMIQEACSNFNVKCFFLLEK